MEIATHNTGYVMIKAHTDSETGRCDYAIIKLDEQWLKQMNRCLSLVEQFDDEDNFSYLVYYGSSEGFYRNSEAVHRDCFITGANNWCFVHTNEEELAGLPDADERLIGSEVFLFKYGTALFTASGKHTGEQYYTERFDIADWITSKNISEHK